jgi:hypothetical protein
LSAKQEVKRATLAFRGLFDPANRSGLVLGTDARNDSPFGVDLKPIPAREDAIFILLPGLGYSAALFACALTFAHRFFAALIIAARPAADKTRFLTPVIS